MKILGTGLSGLVGSRIVALLSSSYAFENLSRATGVDITNGKLLAERITGSNASIVLHLAAKTDVDGCEKDKPLGENGDAWKINVEGTRNIVSACEESGKRLIYISTDFVFDGEKDSEYTEEDVPNPNNWYGMTKYEGEKIVQNSTSPWTIARIAYPYRSSFHKTDFVRGLISRFKEGKELRMVVDHVMTPTFIDDIVTGLGVLIESNTTGIFHVVGSQHLSPYDAALVIADTFGFNRSLVSKTTRAEFFKNRAPRPHRLAISNSKVRGLGITMRTFEEAVAVMKRQQMEAKRKKSE